MRVCKRCVDTMKYFENLQEILQKSKEAMEGQEDPQSSSSTAPKTSKKSDHQRYAPRDTGVHAQFNKSNMKFMNATTLHELQDRHEGGPGMVDGVAVDELGPRTKHDLDAILDRASVLTNIDWQLPTVADTLDTTPNQWSRKSGYAKIFSGLKPTTWTLDGLR